MLGFFALLLTCQLVGEVIARAAGVPLPGPVIGMVLLFIGLMVRGDIPADLQAVARGLLDHLALLFVPAGVGVMLHLTLVADEWRPIAAALIGSTLLTVAVTALVMRALLRVTGGGENGAGGPGPSEPPP